MGDLGKCKILINKLQQTSPHMGMLCDNKNHFQIFETFWVQYLKECKTSNSNILFFIWLLILKYKSMGI